MSELSQDQLKQLDQAQIHNVNSERLVGYTNYEIDIRGKQNLEAVSRKMVMNKSSDLITKNPTNFRNYKDVANEIKEIKHEWDDQMKVLEEKGFLQKELTSSGLEKQKLDYLDFLTKQSVPGPFTTTEAVTSFMENTPESKEKNKRMRIEVRFQKNTSQSFKTDAVHEITMLCTMLRTK